MQFSSFYGFAMKFMRNKSRDSRNDCIQLNCTFRVYKGLFRRFNYQVVFWLSRDCIMKSIIIAFAFVFLLQDVSAQISNNGSCDGTCSTNSSGIDLHSYLGIWYLQQYTPGSISESIKCLYLNATAVVGNTLIAETHFITNPWVSLFIANTIQFSRLNLQRKCGKNFTLKHCCQCQRNRQLQLQRL